MSIAKHFCLLSMSFAISMLRRDGTMKTRSETLALGIMFAMLIVSMASAAPITPVSRHSVIIVESNFQGLISPNPSIVTNQDSVTTFLPFDSSVSAREATASQVSTVTGAGANATLVASGPSEGSEFGYNDAFSTFEYGFDVASAGDYVLHGSIEIASVVPPDFIDAWGRVQLNGPGVNIDFETRENAPFEDSGTLAAGSYLLSREAVASEYWGADVTMNGTLTVIPEPSTLTLTTLGLLALCYRRRNRA